MRWIGGWSAGAVACVLGLGCADDAGPAGGGADPGDAGATGADAADTGAGPDAATTGAGNDSNATDSTDGGDDGAPRAPAPFRSPCGAGDACEGAAGTCVSTSRGDRCTRPCEADSDCAGWRCAFCGDQCPEGSLRLQCVPPEDATDVVACEKGESGLVKVTLAPISGDRHLDDAPCTVQAADADALTYTLSCPGALQEPLTVTMEGSAAMAPPALVAGAAVRLTWEEIPVDLVGGPARFVIRDAGEDRLILASLRGGMDHPVPGDAQPPWKLAPLTFDVLDTGCPLGVNECATSLPLALRAHLDEEQATLLGGGVSELGPGPRWQVHLTNAGRVVTPMDEACADVWPAGLGMVVTRVAE